MFLFAKNEDDEFGWEFVYVSCVEWEYWGWNCFFFFVYRGDFANYF